MVNFIKKYTTINTSLALCALISIAPINIVVAMVLALYCGVIEFATNQRYRIFLKIAVLICYLSGIFFWGQNMLLAVKVLHFSLFIAMVTDLILSIISKENNLIVFVNLFFIGFLSKFNPVFLLILFLFVSFKQKINWKIVSCVGFLATIFIGGALYLKNKNDWNMGALIDNLLVVYYENTQSMDVNYNDYYKNPNGYIILQSSDIELEPYLSVNRFKSFDKGLNEWIGSPLLEKNSDSIGKLFYSFICQCSVSRVDSWNFSTKAGFSGVLNEGPNGKFYQLKPLVNPDYKKDTQPIIAQLSKMLQKEKFSYDKNISKFISKKNDVNFFETYKVGLCRHFASYSALFLQKQGVPAHIVVGYYNPVNKGVVSGKYTLESAHAWVEYFNGKTQQWEIFDGTSLVPLATNNAQWEINKKIIQKEYSYLIVLLPVFLFIVVMIFLGMKYFKKYKVPSGIHPYFYLNSVDYKKWEYWYARYPYWVTQCLLVWSKIKKRP